MSDEINSILGIKSASGPAAPTTNDATIDPKLVGISGWLLFPAFGFAVGPILGIVFLVLALSEFSDVEAVGFGGIFILSLLVNIGLLGFQIYCATQFFGRKRSAPSIVIAFLATGLVANAVLLMVQLGVGAESFAIETGKDLFRSGVGAAIWIPYFRGSQRVRATFVN